MEVVKNMWKSATGDKDKIGWFTFGLNPRARLGFTENDIVLGTVSVGIGENKELDGKNDSNWGLSVTLETPTVKLDGKAIMKQGKLLL